MRKFATLVALVALVAILAGRLMQAATVRERAAALRHPRRGTGSSGWRLRGYRNGGRQPRRGRCLHPRQMLLGKRHPRVGRILRGRRESEGVDRSDICAELVERECVVYGRRGVLHSERIRQMGGSCCNQIQGGSGLVEI